MHPTVIVALRALLVLIGLGTLGAQTGIAVALVVDVRDGGTGILAPVYAGTAVAAVACLQVGLVAIWVLLTMVRQGAIFDERAFRWVTVIPVAGLAAALLLAALCAHAGEVDDAPGLVLIGGAVGVAGAAFALLMVVMHGLLRSATLLRRELDEVV